MFGNDVSVVLAHGAWADGSSWSKVILALQQKGVTAIAAPLPLTSLSDDVVALDRASERVDGRLVLVGHAYAGAVIAAARSEKVKGLVYVAAFLPGDAITLILETVPLYLLFEASLLLATLAERRAARAKPAELRR